MINILQFATGSEKGATPAGDVFASPLAYKGTSVSYSAATVDGEELYKDANNKYFLAYTPVRPGTLRVLDATGTVVSGTIEVDPYTGELSGAGVSNITDGDRAYYIYDNESVPVQAPQIKMDIKSIPITAQSRKLSAIWSFDAKLIA